MRFINNESNQKHNWMDGWTETSVFWTSYKINFHIHTFTHYVHQRLLIISIIVVVVDHRCRTTTTCLPSIRLTQKQAPGESIQSSISSVTRLIWREELHGGNKRYAEDIDRGGSLWWWWSRSYWGGTNNLLQGATLYSNKHWIIS